MGGRAGKGAEKGRTNGAAQGLGIGVVEQAVDRVSLAFQSTEGCDTVGSGPNSFPRIVLVGTDIRHCSGQEKWTVLELLL